MTEDLPTTDDGEPDTDQMAADLGINSLTPHNSVFLTDDTGTVREVVGYDPTAGATKLRLTHDNEIVIVLVADLWRNRKSGALRYAMREFLTDDEVVVARQTLAELTDFARQTMQTAGVTHDEVDDAIEAADEALDDDSEDGSR